VIYIFGTRLYGKVDHVPGLFYVATKFAHVNFVPLFPTEGWLVFDDGRERGVKVSMSGLSVLFGWLRPILIIGGGGALLFAFLALAGSNGNADAIVTAFVLGLVGVCGIGLFFGSYWFVRIGRDRAVRIAEDADLDPRWVHRHFDRMERKAGNANLDTRDDDDDDDDYDDRPARRRRRDDDDDDDDRDEDRNWNRRRRSRDY